MRRASQRCATCGLAGAVAAAEAIPAADALMVQLCRYPAPDPQTAPCMAQRIGRGPWRSHGGELASLAELHEHRPDSRPAYAHAHATLPGVPHMHHGAAGIDFETSAAPQ